MGASGMQVLRGVEDQKAFDAGKNNTTDALGLLALFEDWKRQSRQCRGQRGNARNPEASEVQQPDSGRSAGRTVVAHKTGEITGICHDAGIVYTARPYAGGPHQRHQGR